MLTLLGQVLKRSTSALTLTIWAMATVTVALAGPFGMFAFLPLPNALVYWALLIGLSIIVSNTIKVFTRAFLPHWPQARLELLVPVLFALAYTPILYLVGRVFLGPQALEILTLWECLVIVLVVAYAVTLLQRIYRLGRLRDDAPSPQAEGAAEVRPRLLDRIDAPPDAQVVRVTVDDHYVLLHLRDGTMHRLLMRFADAVAELAGVDGFHTHRSHWVAEGAVMRVERSGGREMAVLVDGATVPVSRTYRDNLVQRGLLPDRTMPGDAAPAE